MSFTAHKVDLSRVIGIYLKSQKGSEDHIEAWQWLLQHAPPDIKVPAMPVNFLRLTHRPEMDLATR